MWFHFLIKISKIFLLCTDTEYRKKIPSRDSLISTDILCHCTGEHLSAVWKHQHQQSQKNTTQTKRLYQVEVLSQSIRVPILIQLQQNTLNGLFLNTATKCVKKCVINICTPFPSHCLRQTHLPFLNSKTFFWLVLQMTSASFISSLIHAHCSSKPNWASSITTASMIIMTSF